MPHFLFIVLHVLAILFGWWGLIITIPLHLIYSLMASGKPAPPGFATHVRCKACAEFVLREAIKCKHCGEALTPQPLSGRPT